MRVQGVKRYSVQKDLKGSAAKLTNNVITK